MAAQALTQTTLAELKTAVDNGDAASYYSILAANGHDYGNLAYQAATKTGFWGIYANDFLAAKAQEFGVPFDHDKIMRDLMNADFILRSDSANEGLPLNSDKIREYHWQVFKDNGLPKEAWTGTLFDERMGPAVWCLSCNPYELQGQDWVGALSGLVNNVNRDWLGTATDFSLFMQTALADGVFSEALADWNLQATGNVTWAGIVKAWTQVPGVVMDGWRKIADLAVDQLTSYNSGGTLLNPTTISYPYNFTDANGVTTQVGTTTSIVFSNGVTLFKYRFNDGVDDADAWRIPSADGGYRDVKTFLNPQHGQMAGWTIDYDRNGNEIRYESRSILAGGDGLKTEIRDSSNNLIDSRVQRIVDDKPVDISFGYDGSSSPYVKEINSINGQPPTDQAAAVAALNDLGVTPDMLATSDGALLAQASGVLSNFDATHPTGAQTLLNGIATYGGTVIDALSLIKAIQSGDPLPIAVSGLRLAAAIDRIDGGGVSYELSGAANVASGVLSLLSLNAALERGDTLGAVTAGATAVGFAASAYLDFAFANPAIFTESTSTAIQLDNILNGTPGVPGVLSYLNLANSIANGDVTGTAVSVLSMMGVPYIGWAYAVYSIIDSLFSDTPDVPDPWGTGQYVWNGTGIGFQSAGETGGNEAVTNVMSSVLSTMNALIAQEQAQNPGSALGIIPNRMPTVGYDMSGYRYTDIDPLSGAEKHPALRFDTNGRPYNATPGSAESYAGIGEAIIRSAIARGAIAPEWEVQTAKLQTDAGDPPAGPTQTFRPVALDLDGDGIETVGKAGSGVAFDVDDSGFMKRAGWVKGDDAFLVLDRNYNGQIDTGREMFSNGTVDISRKGLAGMAWVDANYDGRIAAANDEEWRETA